jgi:predicted metal-dependent HD superfamily phosphohydrolase
LKEAWKRCFDDLGGSMPPPCVWEELVLRYGEHQRAYHTIRHLEECFGWFAQVRSIAARPGEISFALFYHDAIYDTHAADNEERSADLAANVLHEHVRGDSNAERIRSLILATKHDAELEDSDARLLVDIDLSILGAPPERFDEYEREIRKEYEWVGIEDFRRGRRRVLERFLDRPAIYGSSHFHERLEAPARANLRRSVVNIDLIR